MAVVPLAFTVDQGMEAVAAVMGSIVGIQTVNLHALDPFGGWQLEFTIAIESVESVRSHDANPVTRSELGLQS